MAVKPDTTATDSMRSIREPTNNRMMASFRMPALAVVLCGCVTLPAEYLPVAHNPSAAATRDIEPPGPGAVAHASALFLVRAYGSERAAELAAMADEDYQRVMAHTGLFSFRPGGLYPVAVYRGQDEYLAKTGAPRWSGGVAVGNAIYTYESPTIANTLAHEISHLIFQEYMGGPGRLGWFNEGLAVYEELQVSPPDKRREIEEWLASAHESPMPFSEMVTYRPGDRRTHQWYGQSASVARYLVEGGGRTGVARFLEATRAGSNVDQALAQGFPALCTDLASLERHWKETKT